MTAVLLRTQWVLLARSPLFWMVTVGSLLLTLAATWDGSVSRMSLLFAEMASPFFYLAQGLVSVFVAQRERSDQVDELVEAMPYRPSAWILTRSLLLWGVWIGVSLLMWGAGALMIAVVGQPLSLRLLLLNWVTVVPITLALTTATGFVLGTLIRRGVLAYFLTALAWISGPAMMILLAKGSDRLPVPLLEYFASGRAFPLTMAGWYPNGELLLWNRFFALGLSGALVSLVIWLGARRRRLPKRGAAIALLLSVTIATGATARSQQIWSNRYAAYDAEVASLPRTVVAIPGALRADNYTLNLSFDTAAHHITIEGSFDLHNPGPSPVEIAEMTLRRNFAITALTEPSGQPVPFERQDDFLLIQRPLAPGETVRLTAAWQGDVYHWRLRDGPKLGPHIATESIFLPAHYGWYPIPGRFTPSIQAQGYPSTFEKAIAVDLLPPHQPALFHLTANGTSLNLVHNGGWAVTGLFLLGSPYETVTYGDVEVTVSPTNRMKGALFAQEAAEVFAFFQDLIPLGPEPLRVVEMHDNSFYGGAWDGDRQAAPFTLAVHNIEFGQLTPGYVANVNARMIARLWWPARHLRSDQTILYQDLVTFMLRLWQQESGTATVLTPRVNPTIRVLEQIDAALGRETVLQVLRELHALRVVGGPEAEDFEQIVSRFADRLPSVAEPLPVIRP